MYVFCFDPSRTDKKIERRSTLYTLRAHSVYDTLVTQYTQTAMFEVLHVDEIDDEKLDKESEQVNALESEQDTEEQQEACHHPLPPCPGKQRSSVIPAATAATAAAPTKLTFTIPKTRHISVVSAGNRVQRHNLTCFRCEGPHHFRSECSSFRTKLCTHWEAGSCEEAYCPFAHGIENLRRPWLIQEEGERREGRTTDRL